MDFHHPAAAVCCLCGDVGFPANLFRCTTCTHRFQHSYCSNYYGESTTEAIQVCDWCRSTTEHKTSAPGRRGSARKTTVVHGATSHKDKGQTNSASTAAVSNSPRPAPRRYKLLKDVMC